MSQEESAYDKIVFTDLQQEIAKFILHTPAPGKHSARNAIYCIEKAWQLRHIDANMAAFRCITAEEEAATAIFHALKRRRYIGADRLNYRSHLHKLSLLPFFQAIADIFHKTVNMYKPQLIWNRMEKKPRLRLRLTVNIPGGETLHAEPQPPLYFTTLVNGKKYDFARELEKVATERKMKDIMDHLRNVANFRNRLLYAGSDGIPDVTIHDTAILRKRDIVIIHLAIYLLIDQYKEQQLFAQQALDAFLKMLRVIPKEISIT